MSSNFDKLFHTFQVVEMKSKNFDKLFHTFQVVEMKSNLQNTMGFTNETLILKCTMHDISKLFRECNEGGGRE